VFGYILPIYFMIPLPTMSKDWEENKTYN